MDRSGQWRRRGAVLLALLAALGTQAQGIAGPPPEAMEAVRGHEFADVPAAALAPLLAWGQAFYRDDPADPPAQRAHALHALAQLAVLAEQPEEALRHIAAARALQGKALHRPARLVTEELLARAQLGGWSEGRWRREAQRSLAALPWPASEPMLRDLQKPRPDTEVLSGLGALGRTLKDRWPADPQAEQAQPLRLALSRLYLIYQAQRAQPHRATLAEAARQVLRARPPLVEDGRRVTRSPGRTPVRIAIWEPLGADLVALGRQARSASCIRLSGGNACAADPRVAGMDRRRMWWLARGLIDQIEQLDTPAARDTEAEIRKRADGTELTLQLFAATRLTHGTQVAGVALRGLPGVQPVIVHGDPFEPGATPAQVQAAVQRLAGQLRAQKVRVANLSWVEERADLQDELRLFFTELLQALPEVLFVVAAGNADAPLASMGLLPQTLRAPNLLVVGATDTQGLIADFSNYGAPIELYAQGEKLDTMWPGGLPSQFGGTSGAAAEATRLATLLLTHRPQLKATELKQRLLDGADSVPAGAQMAEAARIAHPRRTLQLLLAKR